MKQNVFKNFSTFIRFIAVCLILFMLAMMIPSVGAQDYEDSTEDIETLFDDDSVIAEDEDLRTTEEKLVSQELIVTDTIEFSSQQTDDGKFLQKLTLQVNPSLEQERALGIVSLLRTGSDIAIENSIEAETEDGEHGFVAVRLPYGEEKQLLSFDGLSFNVSGGETIVITYITDIDDSSAQWKLYSGLDSAFDVQEKEEGLAFGFCSVTNTKAGEHPNTPGQPNTLEISDTYVPLRNGNDLQSTDRKPSLPHRGELTDPSFGEDRNESNDYLHKDKPTYPIRNRNWGLGYYNGGGNKVDRPIRGPQRLHDETNSGRAYVYKNGEQGIFYSRDNV